jgi:RNA polymerase sigma-70 factor (ECF subfamily)
VYRSIKKGDSQSMLRVRWNYIGDRLIKILLPRRERAQDLVAFGPKPVPLSVWLDNRLFQCPACLSELVTTSWERSFEAAQAERPVSDASRDDERELVDLAKRDPRQFGALYDRHFQQIYRFVYSRVREQTAAEDVTSEVFMKALKAMPRYQDTGRPFAAWLYQIAVNAIADRYRTLRPTQTLDDFHDLSIAGPALEEVAAQRDEVRRIWALVESLPHQQRTALVLKFQEDMKIEDIAVAMGKSPGAVKLLIHRGVTRLREESSSLRPVE